jgi:ferric-dicitrate binding protein FerR (iron transport regulator)
MDQACQRFREELAALRRGEESSLSPDELRAHVESCPDCRRAENQATAVAELLKACQPPLPPGGFDRLSAAVAALAAESRAPAPAGRRRPTLSLALAAAAAAAAVVVVAVLFGAGLLRTKPVGEKPDAVKPVAVLIEARGSAGLTAGAAVAVGQSLSTGPGGGLRLVTDRGAHLELGENGLLRILGADAVELSHGRLVAAVEKGAAAFRVVTADAEVRTLGTRFSVRADASGTQVTVIEGRVLFRSLAGGETEVVAGQSSLVAGRAAPGRPRTASPEELGQLLPLPAPQMDMIFSVAKGEVAPGGAISARLELVNRSGLTLTLESASRPMPFLFLKVVDAAGRGSFACPLVTGATVDGQPANQAALVLPPEANCQMELDLGAPLDAPGEYRLALIYFGSLRSGAGAWSGSLESRAITVRVKAPAAPRRNGPGTVRGEPRR